MTNDLFIINRMISAYFSKSFNELWKSYFGETYKETINNIYTLIL